MDEEEEDNAEAPPATSPAAASKPDKLSLVKKAAPVSATKKATLLPKTKASGVKKAPAAATIAAAAPEGPLVKRAKNAYFIFNEENRAKVKGRCYIIKCFVCLHKYTIGPLLIFLRQFFLYRRKPWS